MERKTTKLYLNLHNYNSARIIEQVKALAKKDGAMVKNFGFDNELITNRTLLNRINEIEENIKRAKENLKEHPQSEERIKEYIKEKAKKLEELKSMDQPEILIDGGCHSMIVFVLNDIYYSYSINENPLFDFYYCKKPIIGNEKVAKNYYIENLKKWYDSAKKDTYNFLTNEDIKEMALSLYSELINAPISEHFGNGKRQRVNNYSNSERYESIKEEYGKAIIWK